jgi:hypothetical protein
MIAALDKGRMRSLWMHDGAETPIPTRVDIWISFPYYPLARARTHVAMEMALSTLLSDVLPSGPPPT